MLKDHPQVPVRPDSDDNHNDSSSQPNEDVVAADDTREPNQVVTDAIFPNTSLKNQNDNSIGIKLLEAVTHMIQLKKIYNRITAIQVLNLLQVLSHLQETWISGTQLKTMIA